MIVPPAQPCGRIPLGVCPAVDQFGNPLIGIGGMGVGGDDDKRLVVQILDGDVAQRLIRPIVGFVTLQRIDVIPECAAQLGIIVGYHFPCPGIDVSREMFGEIIHIFLQNRAGCRQVFLQLFGRFAAVTAVIAGIGTRSA